MYIKDKTLTLNNYYLIFSSMSLLITETEKTKFEKKPQPHNPQKWPCFRKNYKTILKNKVG